MTTLSTRHGENHDDPRTPESRYRVTAWRNVAAAMCVIGWGGNQFTPLLIAYRQREGYSTVTVDVLLAAYVLGLIPGLLVASALSDRHGRRPVMLVGVAASMLGSAGIAAQSWGEAPIFIGRLLCGLGVGIAMAVGSSWVKELSDPANDPGADAGSGARRASLAITVGLGLGPGCAGVLAQWGPWPLVTPYLVQIGLALPCLMLVCVTPETRENDTADAYPLRHRLRVPAASHRRFLNVVAPMAPWIFTAAAIAYAIVPALVDSRLGHWALLYATVLTVATLGTGVLVQPIARRLDDVSTARAIVVAVMLMCIGVFAAALTAVTKQPWLGFVVAVLLGAGYGIAVVSGLLEIQRIAEPDELAGLTGVYYSLAYIGFLLPATLAALSDWVSYPMMLSAVGLLCISSLAVVARSYRAHLPT